MFVAVFFVALLVAGGHGSFDVRDLDWSIRPADNFFLFVNGRWLNQTSIPPSQTIWGGIVQTKHENNLKLKVILDDLIRTEDPRHPYPTRSVQQQLADFYRAGMNTEAIEQMGLEPLRETLLELEQVSTYEELLFFVARWYQEMNTEIFFEFEVNPDSRNSSINTIQWKVNRLDPTLSVHLRCLAIGL
jgi:putative endopeptidase